MPIGLHGTSAKTWTGVVIVNGKQYSHVKTEYIDKRTCVKCGNVLAGIWEDTPENAINMYPNGRAISVDPYALSTVE